jgi:hypothetical protein
MNYRKMFSVGATALLLTACSDSLNPTPDSAAGTYNLTSVNGEGMPASITVTEQGVAVTLTYSSGSVTIRADGTYSFAASFSVEVAGQTVNEDPTESGTYTISGTTLTITPTDDPTDVTTATLLGNKITVTDSEDGITTVLIFEKQ